MATLTIGICGTTTIFSVLSSLLFSPLPVNDAERLFRVNATDRSQPIRISMPDALEIKKRLQPGDLFGFYARGIRNLENGPEPVMVHVLEVDADLFKVMGLSMAQGRAFGGGANQPGHDCEVVVSWSFWQSHFTGADVTGRAIRLNQQPCLVDGVLPKGLDFPAQADVWVPAVFNLNDRANGRDIQAWDALARAGTSASVLNAQLEVIGRELGREDPADDATLRLNAVPLREWMSRGVKTSVYLLFAAVLGVLIMACANVANLLLANASARMREITVRMAVGASRGMLFQQLLIESLMMALLSSALALVLTEFAVRAIRGLPDIGIPRPDSIVVDWRVMLFAVAISALTGILFGTLPALRVSMVSITGILKQAGGRVTDTRRQQTIRKVLVCAETAIATVLLICSLLLVRSFQQVINTSPGFAPSHLLTAYLSLPPQRYGTDTMQLQRAANKIVTKLNQTSGIESAAVTTNLPLRNSNSAGPVQLQGEPLPSQQGAAIYVTQTDISPGYRKTLGIPLLSGRDLDETDDRENADAILVNATFADTFFHKQNVVGRRIRYNPLVDTDAPWQQIVGVLADTKQDGLVGVVQPEIFIPLARGTGPYPGVIIRTSDAALPHLRDVQTAVREADGNIAVFSPSTMEQAEMRSVGFRAFDTALLSGFAMVALVLASIGIFAVIAYGVSQRTSEIAVRIACGASRMDVAGMIIRQGAMPALAGIAIGAGLAHSASRFLTGLLYGVSAADSQSYAGAMAVLSVVSVGACLIPAARAARLEPWRALRHE